MNPYATLMPPWNRRERLDHVFRAHTAAYDRVPEDAQEGDLIFLTDQGKVFYVTGQVGHEGIRLVREASAVEAGAFFSHIDIPVTVIQPFSPPSEQLIFPSITYTAQAFMFFYAQMVVAHTMMPPEEFLTWIADNKLLNLTKCPQCDQIAFDHTDGCPIEKDIRIKLGALQPFLKTILNAESMAEALPDDPPVPRPRHSSRRRTDDAEDRRN